MEPEVLVLKHVGRDFRPEGFRLLWEGEVFSCLDSLYFRYDRVEDALLFVADVFWYARPACCKAVVSGGMGSVIFWPWW